MSQTNFLKTVVKVGKGFQITIPKEARELSGVKQGERLELVLLKVGCGWLMLLYPAGG
ncbi:MAG: hypothetical protein DRO09_00075 [Thermoprotei archaeon]|nr:MAG: hypothetical protein DRO09_00075 [Thermoprotei archaeon]